MTSMQESSVKGDFEKKLGKMHHLLRASTAKHQEAMIPFRIPSKPWEMDATDLFALEKSKYLVIVDYHSNFYEVLKPSDTKIRGITYTKSIFARNGIPLEVISDNDPRYSSKDFSHCLLNSGNSNTLLSVHG